MTTNNIESMKAGFEAAIEYLRINKFIPTHKCFEIKMDNAEERLRYGLRYFIGEDYKWLNGYDRVVEWMTDNKGKGLLCMGNCGRGKTIICEQILPINIKQCHDKVVTSISALDLNKNPDKYIKDAWLSIDDVGTEDICNKFGNKRMVFAEVVDNAEKEGHLLLITTNLTAEELSKKYGERTLDRLRAITKLVTFQGDSMRQLQK